MSKVPSAVWIVDTNKEHIAVDEAKKLNIPIVAILDTNCDPDVVDYPIPGNDDAIRAVGLLTRIVADAVAEGKMARAGATEEGAEDMPEWERELLEQQQAAAAAETPETPEAAETPADQRTDEAGQTAEAAVETAESETTTGDEASEAASTDQTEENN